MLDTQLAATIPMTIADLRRRFKAICDATNQRFQNYQIRVQRALRWLERALTWMPITSSNDGRFTVRSA
jgi:hypothetical protein